MKKDRRRIGWAGVLLVTLSAVGCGRGGKVADLVFLNGTVWTAESGAPRAEAVAVGNGRVMFVGTSGRARRLIGPETRVVDLNGRLVLPGLIDSHTHFLDGGFALLSLNLKDVRSKEEFVERVGQKAAELEEGEWILNGNWDEKRFDPPELPRREWIDAWTPDHPVCISRHDGHMVLANSLALRIAGITKSTASPPGGEILKDPSTGEPTGILKDAAIDLVGRHIPEPSFEAKLKAGRAALRHAAGCGVTSLHDMGSTANFEVYQELLRRGELTSRIYLFLPVSDVDLLARLKLKSPFCNEFLRIGGLKGFIDGSLGSSTALFFEPYADRPGWTGLLSADMHPEGAMEERILAADGAGLQLAVHAIGDRANAIILDLYEKAIRLNGPRDRRWRVEHAQHLRPEDIERMARLGIIASVQPYHAADDGRWAEGRIGKERCRTTYAFRSLLDRGTVLACGSDWTVAPLDPMTGIWAAVTRQTIDGKHPEGWFPEQKIGLEEALKGYTVNGAYAEFAETIKGTLAVGKLADLVVLDRNLFLLPPEDIRRPRVEMTIVGGRVVYERAAETPERGDGSA